MHVSFVALFLLGASPQGADAPAPAPEAEAEVEPEAERAPDAAATPETQGGFEEATPEAKARPRLFVVDPAVVKLPDAVKKTVSAAIAEAAESEGFDVLARDDVREILKQHTDLALLGGEADGLSLAALGQAVGTRHLIAAVVSNVDDTTVVQMRLIDAKENAVLTRREVKASDYDGKVLEAVRDATKLVLAPLFAHMKGALLLTVSEEGADVLLDGVQIGVTPLEGPISVTGGHHLLTVQKSGFIRHQESFRVEEGSRIERAVKLRPSKEFLEAYRAEAELYRTVAWVSTGAAAAFLGTGVGFGVGWYLGNQSVKALGEERDATTSPVTGGRLNPNVPEDKEILNEYAARIEKEQFNAQLFSVIGLSAAAVGAAATFAAAYFWAFGNDPDRYAEFEEGAE